MQNMVPPQQQHHPPIVIPSIPKPFSFFPFFYSFIQSQFYVRTAYEYNRGYVNKNNTNNKKL